MPTLVTPQRWRLALSTLSRLLEYSLATSMPWLFISAAIWVVLEPGAAAASSSMPSRLTLSLANSAVTGSMELAS
ncbi:hypothetical protein D3C79_1043750 [compost metagenome]